MRKVLISNSVLTDDTYKSNLSSAYSSGTSLSVTSNVSFAADDLAVIGELGEEKTELKRISGISGKTTITLASALNFTHPKDTPVYKVAWDQVSIERNAAVISTSSIQWDKKDTIYYDSPGTASDSYRFRFYNSITTTYSEYSPTVTGAGYGRSSLGYMTREVRKIVQDEDREIVTDDEIARFINAAQDIVAGVRQDWWFLRTEDKTLTTTAGTSKSALPSGIGNLGTVDYVKYNYNDGTTNLVYRLKPKNDVDFDEYIEDNSGDADLRDDYVEYYRLRESDSTSTTGYIEYWPTPKTTGRGTFWVYYFEEMTDLDDVADTTSIPIPQILEDYAIAQVERIKGNEEKAVLYEDKFWGPSGEIKGRRRLTGVALLEQLNQSQKRPIGEPRSLFNYRGRGRTSRPRYRDRDIIHENYW